jgi:hypothetical protein
VGDWVKDSHRPAVGSGCDAVCGEAGPGCPPGLGQPHFPGHSMSEPAQPARPQGAPLSEYGETD